MFCQLKYQILKLVVLKLLGGQVPGAMLRLKVAAMLIIMQFQSAI